MIYWIYLIIASLFETGWIISLKYIKWDQLKNIRLEWSESNFSLVGPLAGYIVFGVGNIYFFSMAMKQIPASTAFAVWMAMALIGLRIIEWVVYKQPGTWMDYFYMALMLAGMIGLKKSGI